MEKDKELKSIITTNIDFGSETFDIKGQKVYLKEDVKKPIQDYKLYASIHNWRFDNIGKPDSEDISQKIKYLEKKYCCKFYELGFDKIFGDFEK